MQCPHKIHRQRHKTSSRNYSVSKTNENNFKFRWSTRFVALKLGKFFACLTHSRSSVQIINKPCWEGIRKATPVKCCAPQSSLHLEREEPWLPKEWVADFYLIYICKMQNSHFLDYLKMTCTYKQCRSCTFRFSLFHNQFYEANP